MPAYDADLRNAWKDMLQRHKWHYTITLTFDPANYSPTLKSAPTWCSRAFRGLVRHLNEQLYGPRWLSKTQHMGSIQTWVYEGHWDGRLHIHALISTPNRAASIELVKSMDRWWRMHYGRAKFEIPDSQEAVVRYLIKGVRRVDGTNIETSRNFHRAPTPH